MFQNPALQDDSGDVVEFDEMGLDGRILNVLKDQGISMPTKIQVIDNRLCIIPVTYIIITICHWVVGIFNSLPTGNIHMLFCRLLIFFKYNYFEKKKVRNTIRVSNSLDPDQARCYVGPDLNPNCLQKLAADDTSR